jgi:hypothetical protein
MELALVRELVLPLGLAGAFGTRLELELVMALLRDLVQDLGVLLVLRRGLEPPLDMERVSGERRALVRA